MAERSKALRSGRSLFGGVGSNPTECILHFDKSEFKMENDRGEPGFRSRCLVVANDVLFRLS